MSKSFVLLAVCALGCSGAMDPDSPYPEARDRPAASDAEGLVGDSGPSRSDDSTAGRHPRRIVYTARLDLVVEDFGPVPAKVAELAEAFGGYVADSNLYGQPGRPRRASWTIRVPVEHYGELLSKARTLGEMRSLATDAKDVSEEYYDVDARIRNKQKTEARLLDLLAEAAGDLEQVLAVEEKLDRVREEIERMQGRLRVLNDLTDLATITIAVEEIQGFRAEERPAYSTRVRRAFFGSLRVLATAATDISIAAVALAPWVVVLVLLVLPIGAVISRASRNRRRRRTRMGPPDGSVVAEVVESEGQGGRADYRS